ncbi:MAG: hypothetical protein IJ165_06980 [Proteobacteria bacterium]|nr:hypothetical protein [Pseudomonadota bacterium]
MLKLEKHGLCIAMAMTALAASACGGNEDPKVDPAKCGDTVCLETQVCDEATQTCVPKQTEPKCTDGKVECDGQCYDLTSDKNNCGKCGTVCNSDESCFNSECVKNTVDECEGEQIKCGDTCVDKLTDTNNCGECGHKCDDNQSCANGLCTDIISPDECSNDEAPVCEGNAVKKCENGSYVLQDCEEDICEDGTCKPKAVEHECDPAVFIPICDGNAVKSCDNEGNFKLDNCQNNQICSDSGAKAECKSNQAPSIKDGDKCTNESDLFLCSDNHVLRCVEDESDAPAQPADPDAPRAWNGTYHDVEDCGLDVCQNGECVTPCDESFVTKCEGNILISCNNGFVSNQSCGDLTCTEEFGEDQAVINAACTEITEPECADDEPQICEGTGIKKCVEGKYVTEACEGNKLCIDGACHAPKIQNLCPDDDSKDGPGVCGCGVPDQDLDNNGIIDCLEFSDLCPDDPKKTLPGICGCNVPDDLNEDGNPYCLVTTLKDNDLCPSDENKTLPGVCGCGYPDTIDPLTRLPKCIGKSKSGEPNNLCLVNEDHDNGEKYLPGVCGCTVADTIDGTHHIPECLFADDLCPEDENKTQPGLCGCGVEESDLDTDKDGVPDCLDQCPNNPNKFLSDRCLCDQIRVSVDGKDICAYPINTAEEFNQYRIAINNGTMTNTASTAFALMSDINLNTIFFTDVDEWVGIKNFKGKFVSSGHKISFTLDGDNRGTLHCVTNQCGLFHSLSGARIDNIKLEFDIDGASGYNGLLAGNVASSTITNVEAVGNVKGNGAYVGGVIGYATDTTLSLLKHKGDVTNLSEQTGGIVGRLNGNCTASNLENTGKVSGTKAHTAGVIGYANNKCVLSNLNASGDIEGQAGYTAGILSYISGSSLSNATFKGNVLGTTYVGGILGGGDSSSLDTASTDASTTVKGTGSAYIGGIIGRANATDVSNVTSNGKVDGRREIGGIAGYLSGNITNATNNAIVNVYNDTGSWGCYSGGIVGNMAGGYTHKNLKNTAAVTCDAKPYTTTDSNGASYETLAGCAVLGGLFGHISNHAKGTFISDAENNGEVTSKAHEAGGIGGLIYTTALSNVKNTANVSGTSYLGGIFGYYDYVNDVQNMVFENVENSGNINATSSYIGGINGLTYVRHENGVLTMNNIANKGKVDVKNSTSWVGGILGFIRNNNAVEMNEIYNTGDVISEGGYVGGLVGGIYVNDDSIMRGSKARKLNFKINRAYSDATIQGTNDVGGLVGRLYTWGYNRELLSSETVRCTHNNAAYRTNIKWKYYDFDQDITIMNAYATGTVIGSGARVGGLVGYAEGSSTNYAPSNTVYFFEYVSDSDKCHASSKTEPTGDTINRTGKFILANAYTSAHIKGQSNTTAGIIGSISNANTVGADYNMIINNVYTAGDIDQLASLALGNKPSNVTYKGVYYWTEAGPDKVSASGDIPGIIGFVFDNAIPTLEEGMLIDALNDNISKSEDPELNPTISEPWVEIKKSLENNLKVKIPSIHDLPKAS